VSCGRACTRLGVRAGAALGVLAFGALAATGCGFDDPYDDPATAGHAQTRTESRPDTTAGGPEAALRQAALESGNWTAATVDDALARARRLSVGAARSQFRRQAEQMSTGVAQATAGIRSRSTVEAVVVRGSHDSRDAIVVTREGITSADLPDEGAQYKVTLATVERTEGGWAISSWTPQP
jgi:hypothetical protein